MLFIIAYWVWSPHSHEIRYSMGDCSLVSFGGVALAEIKVKNCPYTVFLQSCTCGVYGDSMILTECIFSQPAPGSVSSAYFRKLVHFSACGVQIFANTRACFVCKLLKRGAPQAIYALLIN